MNIENRLHSITSGMEYPPTPDIASHVRERLRPSARSRFIPRKLAWSLTIVFVLVSSIVLIPPVRAAVIEFIQIGIVRIFPQPTEAPETLVPPTATPTIQFPSLIPLLDDLAGETNLEDAQEIVSYQILLPTYPSDLGSPDHVYVQDVEGAMTVLVWVDPLQPENVTMSLHFIPVRHWAINKFGPEIIEETTVNGERALWAEGPYPLFLSNGNVEFVRLIEGHVLIWESDGVTYRLETDLGMEEAIKIAESLEPVP